MTYQTRCVFINLNKRQGPWGGGAKAANSLHDYFASKDMNWFNKFSEINSDFSNRGSACYSPALIATDFLCVSMNGEDGSPSLEKLISWKKGWKPDSKIILRVNECDARKGTVGVDERLLNASHHIDGTIFVSQWMYEYFMSKGWACKKNIVIINGVDQNIFRPQTMKSNEVKPISIVTSHWSDNFLKGQDYYEWLDEFVGKYPDKFKYTFIGRTKVRFKNSKHIQPLWGIQLGNELSTHDISINASRRDPGPNSTIESIACGLPTYVHSDGGGSVEFAGTDHTFSSFKDLEDILLSGIYKPNNFGLRTWEEFSDDVFQFMNEVSNG